MKRSLFSQQITPQPYTPAVQSGVQELLANTPFIHRNLNWQSPEVLLAGKDLLACVGLHKNKIAAFLALSMPIAGISWLRIAAVRQGISRGPALRHLWRCVYPQLTHHHVTDVYILMIDEQFLPIWQSLDFRPVETVVQMRLVTAQFTRSATLPHQQIFIRPALEHDLSDILAVDHAAFEPAWQLHARELRAAFDVSQFKLAFTDQAPVGYIATHTGDLHGHISRLAIHPAWQGQGIGSNLLRETMNTFNQLGMQTITVNTQASNSRSQRLYRRFGFSLTGEQWPVFEKLV